MAKGDSIKPDRHPDTIPRTKFFFFLIITGNVYLRVFFFGGVWGGKPSVPLFSLFFPVV